MPTPLEAELLAVTRRLVDAIDRRDYETYRALTSEDITSFEPEARGQRIDGLPFHEFFVGKPLRAGTTARSELIAFQARPLAAAGAGACRAAVACYTRITQKHDADGAFRLSHANETRVYERPEGGAWRQVHFHRSEWT